MKKTILSFVSLALIWFVLAQNTKPIITNVDQLPSTCIQATDADGNTCTRSSGSVWACTLMSSEVKHPIKCLASTDNIPVKSTMCTKEYMPVCWIPTIIQQCWEGMICPQIMPSKKTYSNICTMNAEGATLIYTGTCADMIVGGDLDEHGCKWSAGYSRNTTKQQCTRSREDEVKASCKMLDKDLQLNVKDKSSVKALQSQLKKLGYIKFAPTGNFGKLTQQALRKFQKYNGIQTTGKLWPVTRHALQQVCSVK
jgi:Putative peptidoglycan binding domain